MDIQAQDLGMIGLLIFLEGVLSIDNAVVLALLAGQLPKSLQKRALGYGIAGAILFRVLALASAKALMRWNWVKFVGGGYLLFAGVKYWVTTDEYKARKKRSHGAMSFWKTVVMIELMDSLFAIDSILAAVAIARKLWVILAGGLIGMIGMRFAATLFIRLLEIFPAFEDSAFLLIILIGSKLVVDGCKFSGVDFQSTASPAFWAFWMGMGLALLYGFRKRRHKSKNLEAMMEKEERMSE